MPQFTLTPHVHAYVTSRYRLGEIGGAAVGDYRVRLGALDRSFGNRPLDQFGPAAVDRWREHIAHLAPTTQRAYLSAGRGFCRWLRDRELISVDPMAHVPVVRQPRNVVVTFTRAEVARLLEVAPDERGRAIVMILVGAGARCIEVERLQVADYSPNHRTVKLTGKAGHERIVPIHDETCHAIDSYLDVHGRIGGPMIRSYQRPTQPLRARYIGQLVRRWLFEAGIKASAHDGRSAHGLRRTAGSDIVDICADVRVAQEFLGHQNLATTAEYYLRGLTTDQLRAAVDGRTYTDRTARSCEAVA